MTTVVSFGIKGVNELRQLFKELESDFGEKDQKNILKKATKDSMIPVLLQSKTLAPKDTGLLESNLVLFSRKPTKRDQQSKYVGSDATMIAVVSTKKIPKKLKKETAGKSRKEKQKFYHQKGYIYDGRATAMEFGFKHKSAEFGTAKVPARPYLRTALESQAQNVVDGLAEKLRTAIEKYRAKKGR